MTKTSILIIDDEVDLCQSLLRLLEKEGYQVFIAHSGEEGLIKVKENLPDLILLDLKMSGISGIETLERIITIDKDIPVIMLTAYQTVESAVKAMKLGAYDYINKPFNIEELKIVIKKALRERNLSREVVSLRQQIREKYSFHNIIGKSDKIKEVLYKIEKVAPTNATVLIRGDSGTGKELIAKTIHQYSPRRDKPFIAIDCTSMPETLIESELFGHTKGAFTGAVAKRLGKFELAQGGTFFLDEIGNLSVNIQAKLLRALQEREIIPVGGNYPVKIDVRVIIASNTNLEEEIKKGNFREDLYYRINVFSIPLPTLQERKEDIPLLALYFLNQFNPIFGKKIKDISEECMKLLIDYSWPGNIRELQNVIQQAIIMAEDIILPEHLPDFVAVKKVGRNLIPASLSGEGKNGFPTDFSLKNHIGQLSRDTERRIILEMLKRTNWNKAEAARLLKMNYKTLYLKIKGFNLRPLSQ